MPSSLFSNLNKVIEESNDATNNKEPSGFQDISVIDLFAISKATNIGLGLLVLQTAKDLSCPAVATTESMFLSKW